MDSGSDCLPFNILAMILSFKQQFVTPVRRSMLVEKSTFKSNELTKDWVLMCSNPKIHTIRSDPKDRWANGRQIQFWKGNPRNNKQDTYEFGTGEVVSTQSIAIKWHTQKSLKPLTRYEQGVIYAHSYYFTEKDTWATVQVSGSYLSKKQIDELAINDGFTSKEDFFQWFATDFGGKIIHWTNKRY